MTKILFKQTKKHTKKDPCLFQECPGISLQTEKPVPATQWPPAEAQRFGRRQLDAQVLALRVLELLALWPGSSAPWCTAPLPKPARGWFCTWFRKTWFQTLAFPNPDTAVPLESWESVSCCTWLQVARSEYVQAQTHLPTPAFFLLQHSSLRQLAAVSEALLCLGSVCRSN